MNATDVRTELLAVRLCIRTGIPPQDCSCDACPTALFVNENHVLTHSIRNPLTPDVDRIEHVPPKGR